MTNSLIYILFVRPHRESLTDRLLCDKLYILTTQGVTDETTIGETGPKFLPESIIIAAAVSSVFIVVILAIVIFLIVKKKKSEFYYKAVTV